VTSQQRSKLLPDVPTLAELGLKDFDVTSWYGICAPAGTPKDVIQKINAEVAKATSSPAFQEKLSKLGTETRVATVEDVAKLIKVDADRWAKVISTNHIPKITN
jgi:tripartite-type tricarboxylate transporter receptor subunit TctC